VPISAAGPVQLQIQARGGSYDFRWSKDGRHWQPLLERADGTILSTKKAAGSSARFLACTRTMAVGAAIDF
jgi:alpha-N-arabinofuranosidase